MKRLVMLGFIAILVVTVAGFVSAQKGPGQGPMGPGGSELMHMGGMMQQLTEMMKSGQMTPERMKQMTKMMENMSGMMGSGMMGRGMTRQKMMQGMSQMMEQMSKMQNQMAEMMGESTKK